ncbi:hypothetical protein EON73_00430 [bacterium]|nr:MAG: hypothetical protein EON73_00430 [bacterium]
MINFYFFLHTFRTLVTIFVIIWITPQTSITYYNYVLNAMHSTRLFADYPATKQFVVGVTWFCMISYMITNFLLFN